MARAGRFSTIVPLPPHGEWRRAVALDRGAGPPHPVVLSFVPPSVLDAPDRLAALSRDVEAAGRLHHPSAVRVLGTETVGDSLAIVEDWRPGPTVRALLDAGGRLPPDVAVRIAADVCGALERAHATDAGEGRRLVHGAVSASHVLVGEDGVARLCGFGEAAGGDAAGDLRAVAALLHECLAGEPPGPAVARLDVPGVPPALAGVVDRALGAAPDGPYASAAALADAIAAAPLASAADVAAYADAIVPAEEGGRGALRRAVAQAGGEAPAEPSEEVSEDYIVEPTDPVVPPPSAALARPPQTRPGVDPVGVFQAPQPPRPRSPFPVVLAVASLCGVAGFAIGFAWSLARVPPPPPVSLELPPAAPDAAPAAGPAAAPGGTVATSATTKPPPPAPKTKAPARAAKPAGKATAKATKVAAQKPAAPAGNGTLSVTAPDDADVFLDGKKIGRGTLRVEIAAGVHNIEVRRGEATVAQGFSVEPNETWTYDVTPTPAP